MKSLRINIPLDASPKLDEAGVSIVLMHAAKDIIIMKYENLVLRAHVAKLNAFVVAASERLGIEFHHSDDLELSSVSTSFDAIKTEIEKFAATSVGMAMGLKITAHLADKPEEDSALQDPPVPQK